MKLRLAGFTLIEMLVALTIFSILSMMAYRALDSVLALNERSENTLAQDSSKHRAMTVLLQDFLHMRPRVVRDERGDYQRAFEITDKYIVRFTRGGLPMLASIPAGMQRVAYSLNGEKELLRWVWPQLDGTSDLEPKSRVLLVGVKAFVLELLDKDDSFISVWPPVNEDTAPHILPRMIRFTIEFEDGSKLERLIPGVESSVARKAVSSAGGGGAR